MLHLLVTHTLELALYTAVGVLAASAAVFAYAILWHTVHFLRSIA